MGGGGGERETGSPKYLMTDTEFTAPCQTRPTKLSCRVVSCELDSRGLQTVADRTSQVSTRRCEQFTRQTQTPHQLWRTV